MSDWTNCLSEFRKKSVGKADGLTPRTRVSLVFESRLGSTRIRRLDSKAHSRLYLISEKDILDVLTPRGDTYLQVVQPLLAFGLQALDVFLSWSFGMEYFSNRVC